MLLAFSARVLVILVLAVTALQFTRIDLLRFELSREHFWLHKARTEKTYEVVAVGDSRVLYSFCPRPFDKTVLNYAFLSQTLTKDYLQAALKRLDPKGMLFIGLSPQGLSDYQLQEHWDKIQAKGPWPYEALKKILEGPPLHEVFRGKSHFFSKKVSSEVHHPSGWIESFEESRGGDMRTSYRENFKRFPVRMERLNELTPLLKSFVEQGGQVYVFHAPTEKELYELEIQNNLSGYDALKAREWVHSIGAQWLDIDPRGFQTFDGDHLNGQEACRFTKELKDSISLDPTPPLPTGP